MGEATTREKIQHEVQQALAEERAVIVVAEGEVVTWFRQWHGILSRHLESHLRELATTGTKAVAARLLEGFPRDVEEYSAHLRTAPALPMTAFTDGQGLEMLCYMGLQAMPRHSRVYANVHLKGGWHDADELRAVHQAVIRYEKQLVEAKRQLLEKHRQDVMKGLVDEGKKKRSTGIDDIDIDSDADSDPGAADGANGGEKDDMLKRIRALGREDRGRLLVAQQDAASGAGASAEGDAVGQRAAEDLGWLYLDDHAEVQGPFNTNKMLHWIKKGFLSLERMARPVNAADDAMQALWNWPELNPGAGVAKKRARARWRKAKGVVKLAAAHARTVNKDADFNAFNRALQQRYARSSFGFDALLLRCALGGPREQKLPPSTAQPPASASGPASHRAPRTSHRAGKRTSRSGRRATGARRSWTRSRWSWTLPWRTCCRTSWGTTTGATSARRC